MSQLKIDWDRGLVETGQAGGNGTDWTLVICADWAPIRAYQQPLLNNPIDFYGDLLPVLQGADISVVNIECVLTDNLYPPIPKDGPNLKGPGKAVGALAVVPFHLACLANNHTLDYGPEALADMLDVLHQAGIQTVGAGLKSTDAVSPKLLNLAGCRVAIINAAEGEECRSINGGPGVANLTINRLVNQIADLRKQVDVLIAILHAGRELVPIPPPYICQTYRAIADAGADLVIGHHPHVPQGIEVYGDRLICYSLGNFAFWGKDPRGYSRKGFLIKACFSGASLNQVEFIPYQLLPDRMALLTDDDRIAFLKDIQEVSEVLENSAKVEEAWGAYADDWFYRYGYFQVNCLGNNPSNELTLLKIAFRRLKKHLKLHWQQEIIFQSLIKLFRHQLNRANKSAKKPVETDEATSLIDPMTKAIAKLRNKFDTPAHRELYLTALGRAMTGNTGDWPDWTKSLFKKWGTIN